MALLEEEEEGVGGNQQRQRGEHLAVSGPSGPAPPERGGDEERRQRSSNPPQNRSCNKFQAHAQGQNDAPSLGGSRRGREQLPPAVSRQGPQLHLRVQDLDGDAVGAYTDRLPMKCSMNLADFISAAEQKPQATASSGATDFWVAYTSIDGCRITAELQKPPRWLAASPSR